MRRALSKIDPRLVDHGERVEYIARKCCEASGNRAGFDLSRLSILCALHDIGAYKTDEIDDMVRFETEGTLDHSLYGYLFLKYMTHLSDCAEALLYHHTDYSQMEKLDCGCRRYAEMIHLADRADILLHAPGGDLSTLRALAGSKFNPDYVEAFFAAESRFGLAHKLASGAYKRESDDFERSLDIKSSEIIRYLQLLVYAMDFRSPYTVTHTADTTIISLETGRLLGLGERELEKLYIGAFLHDIGKIAIPHGILEKPGRLTREEFAIVQEHIPEGEQILRGVISDEICDIALRHHETLDGSGYSRGLTAEALTLPQRIVAVSDILSALSQRRSYKEAYPKPKVVSILEEMKNAGRLCPQVVDTVCRHYDRILDNTARSNNPVKTMYGDMTREYAARCAYSGYTPDGIQ